MSSEASKPTSPGGGIPAGFIALDPAEIQDALAGYEDELAGDQKMIEALYRQHTSCPRGCGPTMQKHAASVPFAFGDSRWLVPRCLLRCSHCGAVLNPFDGMIVNLGDPDRANAGGLVVGHPIKSSSDSR